MIKEIMNFEDYYISTEGKVFSKKSGELKELKPFLDSKKRYLIITLCKNGKRYKKLIHRLVAETFIKNDSNKNVVNHKNSITTDNNVNNLEWCTTQENVHHSYKKMDACRNYVRCKLFYNNCFIGDFKSILSASKYAAFIDNKCSFSGINRNLSSGNCYIKKCND